MRAAKAADRAHPMIKAATKMMSALKAGRGRQHSAAIDGPVIQRSKSSQLVGSIGSSDAGPMALKDLKEASSQLALVSSGIKEGKQLKKAAPKLALEYTGVSVCGGRHVMSQRLTILFVLSARQAQGNFAGCARGRRVWWTRLDGNHALRVDDVIWDTGTRATAEKAHRE